jgi:hypothetical protein
MQRDEDRRELTSWFGIPPDAARYAAGSGARGVRSGRPPGRCGITEKAAADNGSSRGPFDEVEQVGLHLDHIGHVVALAVVHPRCSSRSGSGRPGSRPSPKESRALLIARAFGLVLE